MGYEKLPTYCTSFTVGSMRRSILLVLLMLGSCATGNKQLLLDAVHEYSHGLRWGQTAFVSRYLPTKQRPAFAALQEASGVRVTTCLVKGIHVPKKAHATVTLSVTWYALQTMRAHQTIIQQKWVDTGKGWRITEQRRLHGMPLPLISRLPALAKKTKK